MNFYKILEECYVEILCYIILVVSLWLFGDSKKSFGGPAVCPGGHALGVITARDTNQVHRDGDPHLTPTHTGYRRDKPYINK
jgi:hypothetical protein